MEPSLQKPSITEKFISLAILLFVFLVALLLSYILFMVAIAAIFIGLAFYLFKYWRVLPTTTKIYVILTLLWLNPVTAYLISPVIWIILSLLIFAYIISNKKITFYY